MYIFLTLEFTLLRKISFDEKLPVWQFLMIQKNYQYTVQNLEIQG